VSDLAVPSWRTRPEKQGPSWRMLAVAGGLLGTVALAGAVVWGLSRMGPRPVPVIEPDARPLKVRPENPGGLIVPNQDQLVLEPSSVRREAERRGSNARLDAGPEAPALDLLRQQAAPTPPPVPALQPPVAALPPPAVGQPPIAAAPPPVAAPPAASVPAVARPGPAANGRTLVQLAALGSEDAARAEWDRLVRRVPELAGFQPRITRLERDGQSPLFRLRTGSLADVPAARALCEAVKAKGASCVPVGS
jgi:hypothetical protein